MNGVKLVPAGIALAALLGSLVPAGSAHAGSEGRKNTTAVLGAVTAHELIKGRTNNAILTGAGTVVAYKKYRDEKKKEDRRERRSERRERRHFRSRGEGKSLSEVLGNAGR